MFSFLRRLYWHFFVPTSQLTDGQKDYGPETRLFKEARSWKFEFHEEVRTLLLIGVVRHEHGEKFIAEFLVDVVESVEFV